MSKVADVFRRPSVLIETPVFVFPALFSFFLFFSHVLSLIK